MPIAIALSSSRSEGIGRRSRPIGRPEHDRHAGDEAEQQGFAEIHELPLL